MIDYPEKIRLTDKVAYIAGGLGLIGTEITNAFAAAGAKTVILDVADKKGKDSEKVLSDAGYRVYYENFDITELDSVENRIDTLVDKYNGIDVWVNTAYPATSDWANPVERLSLDSWRRNVDMHLNSYSWISRKVCMSMRDHGGSVINMGSIYGVIGSDFTIYEGTEMTSPMAYAAIKGGIINLTRYLSSYFGKYNIRVNNICPGGIFNHQDGVFVANYERKVPLKRMGRPEEIASTVLFLASDASSYITGATVMVDGGWTIV